MATLEAGKTAEDLRREIDELQRQQREINERLRDPRGLRKNGPQGGTARNIDANGPHLRNNASRGVIRRVEGFGGEDQRPRKRRLLSAVVKVTEEVESTENEKEKEGNEEVHPDKDDADEENDVADRRPTLQRNYNADDSNSLPSTDSQRRGRSDSNTRTPSAGGHRSGGPGGPGGPRRLPRERGFLVRVSNPVGQHIEDAQAGEPVPRVLPKTSDPNVAKRNRRMFGALLGTLEKFRQEDKKLSGSESFQRRSEQLRKAEQKAQEESERLRQQEKEALAEKRRADLTLRAKLAAEAEVKQLELLFLQWAEHHTRLASFIRTKAGPGIYYLPVKSCEKTDNLLQEAQQELAEWKTRSREELSECQRQISELNMANLDVEIERWKNGPPGRSKVSSDILTAEANTVGDGDDKVLEQAGEGIDVVEDEDDETGAMVIEDEERVISEEAETNKLISV
ncbi:uncharacterized protein [Physcomitrium patens]|uniref:Pinin/SDK/MemA protein domain-containing protein n=1 Tax=Physcomitrium patens TaxID=3218 RepID=A0A2K1JHJ8_PHYPA|nr:pinin-like isoform X2 [Physcomitrium patens]PNR41032.1 hypothetical protein PHYPA_018435 [Physcomitrium patens]|eukprot:XP_024393795.1 pinin-like isoform X2 [Physcomitrella patens]